MRYKGIPYGVNQEVLTNHTGANPNFWLQTRLFLLSICHEFLREGSKGIPTLEGMYLAAFSAAKYRSKAESCRA